MKRSSLKKWLFRICAIAILGISGMYVSNAYFYEGEGLCCQLPEESCTHPAFGEFEDSEWRAGVATCTTGGGYVSVTGTGGEGGSGSGGSGSGGDGAQGGSGQN